MKFRFFADLAEVGRVSRQFAHDAVMSPLRKYVIYSVIFHVVLIGALSVNMILPKKPPAAASATTTTAAPAAKDPAAPPAAKGAAAKPDQPPKPPSAPDKPTGQKDDYYKRQGIDNTPAKSDEIPKNPFEARDEIKKTLDDLK